ncbi:MAG TPA: ATP-dependent DNA helicase RecG, partial [Patescibacteria group bacterium]|nr:ATP-dependent DNA helicase RecG [Patescibacteria group bacterium]
MRPESLYPLFAPITSLPGVGPRLAPLIERVAGPHVVDLLWHLPYALIDRRVMRKVAEAPDGAVTTLRVRVDQHHPSDSARRPYRVLCSDDSGFLTLVFFHAKRDWLEKLLPVGSERIVSGTVEHFNNEFQITHPDHVVPVDKIAEVMTIEPVYPLTAGLASKVMVKAVRGAVERAPNLPEWIESTVLAHHRWPSWHEALKRLHAPQSSAELAPESIARSRLAYDEMLSNQLALAMVRLSLRKLAGRVTIGDGQLRRRIRDALPFALTGAQERSLSEIEADLASPARMLRLLQ